MQPNLDPETCRGGSDYIQVDILFFSFSLFVFFSFLMKHTMQPNLEIETYPKSNDYV